MKKIIFSILICVMSLSFKAQNSFGEIGYTHPDSTILSCGKITQLSPGFILAGFKKVANTYNFTIDRTDMGGAFTGNPAVFRKEYQISADISGFCTPGGATSISSCHGVCVIESKIAAIQSEYAVVATFDEGCIFSFLDINGSPINTNTFFFPFPAGVTVTKPNIIEDPNAAGNYFITGNYNTRLYAIYVDFTGAVSWSYTYPIAGRANAYTFNSLSGNLGVVGRRTINGDTDGFLMEILPASGAVNYFNTYDYNNLYQEFSSISPASNPGSGYIIGGKCETASGFYRMYNLNTNVTGSINWDNVITANADITADNFVGISEAFFSTVARYYAVASSTAGIIAIRMDNLGAPSWPGVLDEFVYNAAGVNLVASDIGYLQGTGYDEGLHIFGTDYNSTPPGNYLVNAYFNGYNGCSTPGFHFTSWSSVCNVSFSTLSTLTGLSICNVASLSTNGGGSDVAFCGPYSSVAGGSNARPVSVSKNFIKNAQLVASPNPAVSQVSISSVGRVFDAIQIADNTGKLLYSKTLEIPLENFEIDLLSLQFNNGIYFVTISTEDGPVRTKLAIESNH